MDKQFSFVIVNYNYLEELKVLLASLSKNIPQSNYEIVIIDNASTDGSKEYFSSLGHEVLYTYLEQNIGYGAANNLGVEKATTDRIVMINPDTIIQQDCFEEFVKMIDDKAIGVLAPKVVYADGKIQPNCGAFSTLKTYILQSFKVGYYVRKYNLVHALKKVFDYLPFFKNTFITTYLNNFSSDDKERKECEWVSGACMVMRKDSFNKVNGFDENFFLYCEDEDLCRRIGEQGYKILIDKRCTIVHNEGFIKARKSHALSVVEKYRHQSGIYYLKKHVGSFSAIFLQGFYFVEYFIKGVFYCFFDFHASKTYFKSIPILFSGIVKE